MAAITVQINTRTTAQVAEPIICRLCKEYDVTVYIVRAQINDDYGFVEINVEGELEAVQRAISWLHTTGLQVNAVQRSVGKDGANL